MKIILIMIIFIVVIPIFRVEIFITESKIDLVSNNYLLFALD